MITLYTIGFTKKSAEQFFELLKKNHVQTLVDVRISNSSQLAGFAKGSDLIYFFKQILHSSKEIQQKLLIEMKNQLEVIK